MDLVWYVAQLKPGGAGIAEENLRRQGFDVFAPKVRRPVGSHRRAREELKLLFPGYLFVRSAPQASCWRSIGGTLGVQRLLRFGQDRPSAVPGDVIGWLKEQCGQWSARKREMLRKGDLVRVVSGPFCDLMARVEKLPSRERIHVLLEFMGRERRVSVALAQLLPQPH